MQAHASDGARRNQPLLGGFKAGAPAEVFAGVWSPVGSVLTAPELTALAGRIGM